MKFKTSFAVTSICAVIIACAFRPAGGESEEYYDEYTEEIAEGEARVIVTEERNVGGFDSVSSSGSIPVTYVQANISKVVISGSPEFIDKLITEVRGGTLHIEMKRGSYHNLNLAVTIMSPVLDAARMSGSGSFTDIAGHKTIGNVSYSSSGSGRINVGHIECGSFDCHLSGSGRLTVDDIVCTSADLATSGSGGLTVKKITTRGNVSVRLSGSGYGLIDEANIGDVDLRISGSGSIKINGRARDVSATISGSGSVMGDLEYRHVNTRTSGSGRVRL